MLGALKDLIQLDMTRFVCPKKKHRKRPHSVLIDNLQSFLNFSAVVAYLPNIPVKEKSNMNRCPDKDQPITVHHMVESILSLKKKQTQPCSGAIFSTNELRNH